MTEMFFSSNWFGFTHDQESSASLVSESSLIQYRIENYSPKQTVLVTSTNQE